MWYNFVSLKKSESLFHKEQIALVFEKVKRAICSFGSFKKSNESTWLTTLFFLKSKKSERTKSERTKSERTKSERTKSERTKTWEQKSKFPTLVSISMFCFYLWNPGEICDNLSRLFWLCAASLVCSVCCSRNLCQILVCRIRVQV